MNSISRYQLVAMLIITDVFGVFCLSGSISLMTVYGMLSAIALQFLLSLIFALYGENSARWQQIIYLMWFSVAEFFFLCCGGQVKLYIFHMRAGTRYLGDLLRQVLSHLYVFIVHQQD